MKLSILIPSIPERFDKAIKLYNKCLEQATDEVEVVMLTDNKKKSIGAKRNELISMAQGIYFTILDDDDDITNDYVETLLPYMEDFHDVITYKQKCFIEDYSFIVTFGMNNEIEHNTKDGRYQDCMRPPWHCCVWLRERYKIIKFPDVSYGEDGVWAYRS